MAYSRERHTYLKFRLKSPINRSPLTGFAHSIQLGLSFSVLLSFGGNNDLEDDVLFLSVQALAEIILKSGAEAVENITVCFRFVSQRLAVVRISRGGGKRTGSQL